MSTFNVIMPDNETILAGIGMLCRVLASQYGPGVFRGELRDLRDELHALCVEMEDNGECEANENVYLHLFDALAFVTEALRGPGVKIPLLHKARAALVLLRDAGRDQS